VSLLIRCAAPLDFLVVADVICERSADNPSLRFLRLVVRGFAAVLRNGCNPSNQESVCGVDYRDFSV